MRTSCVRTCAKAPAYQTKGYLDFAVTGDSIAIDPASGKAKLIIQVDEGPQYKIAGVQRRG
jgi:outer membrane protein assembly factor BamA